MGENGVWKFGGEPEICASCLQCWLEGAGSPPLGEAIAPWLGGPPHRRGPEEGHGRVGSSQDRNPRLIAQTITQSPPQSPSKCLLKPCDPGLGLSQQENPTKDTAR